MDAVAYNTLMKGHLRLSHFEKVFGLREQMVTQGIQLTEVTYGILLDACVSAGDFGMAKAVFEDLRSSGLRLNSVHCTSFIKGLVAGGQLQQAGVLLQDMLKSPNTAPDLVTYSTLVKAYADRGDVESAVRAVDQLMAQGITPDEIVFNSVLTACSVQTPEPATVIELLQSLVRRGLRPSSATLSIVLKALALKGAWEESLKLLKEAPSKFGTKPEQRLFSQLAQASVKAGHGRIAYEAYIAMSAAAEMRNEQVDSEITERLLRHLAHCGDSETLAKLQQVTGRGSSARVKTAQTGRPMPHPWSKAAR